GRVVDRAVAGIGVEAEIVERGAVGAGVGGDGDRVGGARGFQQQPAVAGEFDPVLVGQRRVDGVDERLDGGVGGGGEVHRVAGAVADGDGGGGGKAEGGGRGRGGQVRRRSGDDSGRRRCRQRLRQRSPGGAEQVGDLGDAVVGLIQRALRQVHLVEQRVEVRHAGLERIRHEEIGGVVERGVDL